WLALSRLSSGNGHWRTTRYMEKESKKGLWRGRAVQKVEPAISASQPLPMSLILLVALAVHAPLLLMKLPLKSYDTNFHIFFASHYLHNWFNPWNTKWYAGFSQTTYPPLPQQWLALISHITGLDLAYMVVQLIAILLLAVGAYRFSLLWV